MLLLLGGTVLMMAMASVKLLLWLDTSQDQKVVVGTKKKKSTSAFESVVGVETSNTHTLPLERLSLSSLNPLIETRSHPSRNRYSFVAIVI